MNGNLIRIDILLEESAVPYTCLPIRVGYLVAFPTGQLTLSCPMLVMLCFTVYGDNGGVFGEHINATHSYVVLLILQVLDEHPV